jgi:predicted permease
VSAVRSLIWRLGHLVRPSRMEREMGDELAFHIQSRAEDLVREGLSQQDAERQARLDFGGIERYKEQCRDTRGVPVFENAVRDLIYAWRRLRRSPVLVLVATLSLGLGIGVNATLLGALSAIFLRVPTMMDPAGVVGVEPGNSNQFSFLNYRDLRDSQIFADVVGSRVTVLNLRSRDKVERINGLAVTANFFDGLGVGAGLGRVFTRDEAGPERDPRLAVLSYACWHRRFGGDPAVLGQTLNLNGQSFVVLGVLHEQYRPVTGFISPDVYVPLSGLVFPSLNRRVNGNSLALLGRLPSHTTPEQAQLAVTALAQQLERTYPKDNEGFSRPSRVFPVRGMQVRGSHGLILFPVLLLVLFGLVLLIACSNVAGLLLARATARRGEFAIRLALGAARARLIQSMLVESFLLALLGAGAGLLLAVWLLPMLSVVTLPNQQPIQLSIESDLTLYLYGLGLALASGLLCGIVPALRASDVSVLADVQRAGSRGITGRLWLRHSFVVGQVAASVVLLVVSSLFLRSLMRIAKLSPGFDLDHGVVATFYLEPNRYTGEAAALFADRVLERADRIPGVRSSSVASVVPLAGDTSAARFQIQGRPPTRNARTYLNNVGPRYFDTMGIRLLRGRDFRPSDRVGSPPVAIVNEAFQRAYFPGEDAVGQHVGYGGESFSEIVGLVKDSAYESVAEEPTPVLYYSYAQVPSLSTQARPLVVHLRTDGDPAGAIRSVTRAIADVDNKVAFDVKTIREATTFEFALRRLGSVLLGSLGAVGLLLATIGLYGVVAYAVASRTPEIGIRMALGASSHRVLWSVLGQGLRLVGLGVAVGTLLSLLMTRVIADLLAGVSPTDPITFVGTAIVLAVTGLVASYVPARRATRIDPLMALRQE